MRAQTRILLAALALFTLPACSSSGDNPQPPTFTSSATSGGGGGAGGAGGGEGSGGAGGSGGGQSCDGPNGCYACPPTKSEQFLNACTDAQCSFFDNEKRLPLYNGGKLPPLP